MEGTEVETWTGIGWKGRWPIKGLEEFEEDKEPEVGNDPELESAADADNGRFNSTVDCCARSCNVAIALESKLGGGSILISSLGTTTPGREGAVVETVKAGREGGVVEDVTAGMEEGALSSLIRPRDSNEGS